MNNLTQLYQQIKGFAEDHLMINEFLLISSEDELSQRELNYRAMIMLPLEANLSRELSSPIYTLDFGIIVIDKTLIENELSYVQSTEENIFIMGQLQDYLSQQGEDVDFDDVELTSSVSDDYNITIAMTDFKVNLARKPYNRGIDN
jgi:hypothetical protein